MTKFILPPWVKKHNRMDYEKVTTDTINKLRKGLERFNIEDPEVTIAIPAFNEEKDLLKTLSSFSEVVTKYKTELIVANNNSTDRTQEILDACNVKSILVNEPGVSYARQAALEEAKGKFILNADSDSIYPPGWIDAMVEPLLNNEISCAYGKYSFIPGDNSSRISLGLYESVTSSFFKFKSRNRECVNVMGFNFSFRREDGLQVGGFKHDLDRKSTGRCEDGWMAYSLLKLGRLQLVTDRKAKAWTSDRRLMMDGSLSKAFTKRVKKEVVRLGVYLKPTT